MNANLKIAVLTILLSVAPMAGTGPACAHDSRPVYIEVKEIGSHLFQVKWKTPPSLPAFAAPRVLLPSHCSNAQPQSDPLGRNRSEGREIYSCPQGLGGARITIDYPIMNPSLSTLIRLSYQSGEQVSKLLGPQETVWQVPAAETFGGIARDYTRLGIHHIWSGIDHLLFLVCLIWIAGSLPRLLVTITGFTLAHSVTLSLAALKIVQVPVPPVEATIALSIVFVAREIAIGRRDNLTWRYPIAVSSSFGLLHGFGFAAALAESGLPQTELVPGLLFFNLGVEIGQVLFVTLIAALFAIARFALRLDLQNLIDFWRQTVPQNRSAARIGDSVQKLAQGRRWRLPAYAEYPLVPAHVAAGYGVGILATFWFIERCAGFMN